MQIAKDLVSWPTVEFAALTRVEELRLSLETAKPADVAHLQGEIAGLRWLLRAAEPPSVQLLTPIE